jgi:hypothetical protein
MELGGEESHTGGGRNKGSAGSDPTGGGGAEEVEESGAAEETRNGGNPKEKKRKGKNIGENGGNTDDREDLENPFLVGERMKKARLTQAKNQGAATLFELGRRNTRSPVNDPRSPKRGKWGSKPMDNTLNGREVHVQAGAAGCAAMEDVDQLFMGPD